MIMPQLITLFISLFAMHPASLLSLVLSIILTAVPKVLKSSFLDFVLFPYRESSQPDWSELLTQFYCKLKKFDQDAKMKDWWPQRTQTQLIFLPHQVNGYYSFIKLF